MEWPDYLMGTPPPNQAPQHGGDDSVSHAGPRLAERARVPRPDLAVTAAGGVRRLGVLGEIEAGHLVLLGDPKPHDGVKNLQDADRPHTGQHPGCDDGDDLGLHLPGVAVEESVSAVGIDRLGGKEPGCDGPPGAANAVDPYHIQRVVVAELRFYVAGVVAEKARHGPDDDGCQGVHKPGGG